MNEPRDTDYMPLREVVYMTLRRQILRGDLKPGERLMEIALAQKLGVSRTPIREAIRKLENEGLVTIAPRRGAQVARITLQELNDVLEVREALEILAIRKACELVTREDLIRIHEAQESFTRLTQNPETDINTLGDADEHFHDMIYETTHNRRLMQMIDNLREQMYRFRIELLKKQSVREKLVGEHNEMIAALESHDVTRCINTVQIHIDNQRSAISESISE
ncbi:MAG: GntR family transcriptional regulator [Lachnospiraceae bacterium]|nr:GntR family transcriptional regulator [Lachnospiraceae bacterium]